MQAYAEMIHCSDKRRLFLSGNKARLRQFATEDFYKAVDSSYEKGYIHLFLIDKEGCIRGIYNGLQLKEVDNLLMILICLKLHIISRMKNNTKTNTIKTLYKT